MENRQFHRRWVRVAWLIGLTLPLLQTGTCVEILERTVINSVFDATTPVLNDAVQTRLDEYYGVTSGP